LGTIINLSSTGSLNAPRRECEDLYITPHKVDSGNRVSSFKLGADRVYLGHHTVILIAIAFHAIIAN
jgi:hypothetical protein